MRTKPLILVVDDEESIRFTFATFLADEGYRVETAADFDEALERFAAAEPDLVFADILLGGQTGIDLLRELKARQMSSPLVLITGSPDLQTAGEAVRFGAFDYIPKPIKKDTLLRVTGIALKHRALAREKEKYRLNLEAIFNSVKDAIITVDQNLNVVEFNAAAERFCGLGREAIGHPFGPLGDSCPAACREYLAESVASRKSLEVHRLACGSSRIVSLSISPLIDSRQAHAGAVMVLRDETRIDVLERNLNERRQFHRLCGQSDRMQEVYGLIEALAEVETTVLVTGESGTGKELAAEALHFAGSRRNQPLVKVNCSALSENLLESELFGHVRGAFTGALNDKVGRFQKADGGTLFLDEIGDISPGLQVRLLRVLQEKEFERVGDVTPTRVDVRIVAATNQDLAEKVRRKQFRQDLYYRLKVVNIDLPPLRERRTDIPLLAEHFLAKFNAKFGKQIQGVAEEAMKVLLAHPWPGNVRELEHAIEHAFVLCRGAWIGREHLPEDLTPPLPAGAAGKVDGRPGAEALLQALERAGGNKTRAARLLGISRRTFYRKLTELGLDL